MSPDELNEWISYAAFGWKNGTLNYCDSIDLMINIVEVFCKKYEEADFAQWIQEAFYDFTLTPDGYIKDMAYEIGIMLKETLEEMWNPHES